MVGGNAKVSHGIDGLASADFSHILVDVRGQPGTLSVKQKGQLVVITVSEINDANGSSRRDGLLKEPACSKGLIIFVRREHEDPVLVRQREEGWKIGGWIRPDSRRAGGDEQG